MSFRYLQFSQKMNKKIQLYYHGTSSWIVFVRFLGELKMPKRHFEINWPLVLFQVFHLGEATVFPQIIAATTICGNKVYDLKRTKMEQIVFKNWPYCVMPTSKARKMTYA